MNWEAWLTISVIGLAFVGLIRNMAPPDILLLGGTVLLALAGVITPEEAFRGFTNQGMLTVGALFVVAAGLRETGVLDAVSTYILGRTNKDKTILLRLAPPVVAMSAFMNNTPIVAMLLPVVTDWCRRHHVSPSRLLLPLSYLAILGGTCTLIGTSTNLVVSGMMRKHGLEAMGFFEIGMIGFPCAIAGVVYLLLLGCRLLPDRKDLLEQLDQSPREYLVDMVIQPECRLVGKRVEEAGLRRLPGLFLIDITRGEQLISPVAPDQILQAGDRLTFTGVVSTIVDLERIPGLVPAADDTYETGFSERRTRRLAEAVISPTSPLIGKNIRDADFRALYNAAVVAVHRGGTRLQTRIGDIVLRAGDALLLQTTSHFARAHRNNPDFVLVSSIEASRPVRHDRALLSLLCLLLLVVLMATTKLTGLPIVLAAFLAAGLMVATRCISSADARQSIDWQVLLTIGGSLGLAAAIERTGAAKSIAEAIFNSAHSFGPTTALILVYMMTVLFTELVTNIAAAVLVFPFGMAIASTMGLESRPFAMAITFAASASFITPIGYQTNLMVFGPGGYRFTDYVRVGLPLSLLVCIVACFLIPKIWPFVI